MHTQSTYTALLMLLALGGCSGMRPAELGVHEGRLASCPASPNCVSSRSSDRDHGIEPFPYTGTASEAITDMREIIERMKRTKVITAAGGYLHAEFASALFRFVDDVEFYADENAKLLQVRSAARTGYWDLGVNRRRMEKIREQWKTLKKE
jgi:uncharacterized protein (DUF1499 family)